MQIWPCVELGWCPIPKLEILFCCSFWACQQAVWLAKWGGSIKDLFPNQLWLTFCVYLTFVTLRKIIYVINFTKKHSTSSNFVVFVFCYVTADWLMMHDVINRTTEMENVVCCLLFQSDKKVRKSLKNSMNTLKVCCNHLIYHLFIKILHIFGKTTQKSRISNFVMGDRSSSKQGHQKISA